MKLQTKKTQRIMRVMPARLCFAASGVLFLAGSIGLTYHFAQASASEYSLAANSVTLDGTSDGSATVSLKTSVARTYTAVDGKWSLHEAGSGETKFFNLSEIARGESAGAGNIQTGVVSWFSSEDAQNMSVAANGNVLTATYTVNKNTPAGTYKVSFSEGAFMYNTNGTDVNETDTIALDATITVARNESNNDNNNNNNNNNNDNDNDNNNNNNDDDNNNNNNNNNDNNNNDDNNDDNNNDNNNNNNNNDNNNNGDNAPNSNENMGGNTGTESDKGDNNTASATDPKNPSRDSGGSPAAPNTGKMTQGDNGVGAVVNSVASIIASAVLLVVAVYAKSHKKIDTKDNA